MEDDVLVTSANLVAIQSPEHFWFQRSLAAIEKLYP